jgi:hypothetical protein
MVASNSIFSIRQTNLLTRIHRINFKWGMGRKLGLESCMHTTLWAFYGKAKRRDVLSSYVCTSIVQFWTNNTRVSPNVKDVVERCLSWKSWEMHPTYLLLESYVCYFD